MSIGYAGIHIQDIEHLSIAQLSWKGTALNQPTLSMQKGGVALKSRTAGPMQDRRMVELTWQSERSSSRLMPPLKLLSSATVPTRRRTEMTDAVVSSRLFELCKVKGFPSINRVNLQACSSF